MLVRKIAGAYIKTVNNISHVASIIAVIFLMVMTLLTVVDVFLRYVFNSPISGSYELMEYFVVCAGLLGIAWCAIKGGHLKVDVLVNKLSERKQNLTDLFTYLLGLSVVPLVAWQSFEQTKEMYISKNSSMLLDIPSYPFVAAIGIGYSLLTLVMITLTVNCLIKVFKR